MPSFTRIAQPECPFRIGILSPNSHGGYISAIVPAEQTQMLERHLDQVLAAAS